MFMEHLIHSTKEAMADGQSLTTMQRKTQLLDVSRQVRGVFQNGLGIATSASHTKPDTRTALKEIAKEILKGLPVKLTTWTNPWKRGATADVKKAAKWETLPEKDISEMKEGVGEVEVEDDE